MSAIEHLPIHEEVVRGLPIRISPVWAWWILWSVAPPLIVAALRAIGAAP